MVRLTIVFAALLIAFAGAANAKEWPGYSGLAYVEKNIYLAVNDRKNSTDPRYYEVGPRVTIVRIAAENGVKYEPVIASSDDWNDRDGEPSDLEACCSIPGHPYEFFLSESGTFRKKFGRIFHVRLAKEADHKWRLTILKSMRIFHHPLDQDQSTYKGDEVEGISCFTADDNRLVLVYAKRGGLTKGGQKTARLVWGELDLNKHEFKKLGEEALVISSVLGDRDCADIFLKPGNGSQVVWSVATIDEGDLGPFKSAIYRGGAFIMDSSNREMRFVREPKPLIRWRLDGIKVEALATPTPFVPRSGFTIGTDDEDYGGILRPLFE